MLTVVSVLYHYVVLHITQRRVRKLERKLALYLAYLRLVNHGDSHVIH